MTQTLTPDEVTTAEVVEKPSPGGRPPKYDTNVTLTYDMLTPIDQQIVDYFAMDGLVPNDGRFEGKKGSLAQVSAQDFAQYLGYASRRSIYDRRRDIPGFDKIMLARISLLQARYLVPAIFKGVGLRAMRGDAKQAEMLLSHLGIYTPPAQKHEVKIDGLAEAVNAARAAARERSAIPVEAVDVKVADSIPLSPTSPQPGDNEATELTSIPEPELVSIPAPNVNQIDDSVAKTSANVNEIEANVAPKESPAPVKTSDPVTNALPIQAAPDESGDEFDEFGDRVTVREFE